MRTNVHGAHISVKPECACHVVYSAKPLVHHVYMAKKQVIPRFKTTPYRRTFIRQWRKKSGLTLEQVGDAVNLSHAQLGRIERGLQPYNQELLEALALLFNTEPASLLMRDPSDPEGIWSLWDKAEQGDRKMIVDLARTVLKTGT